MTRNIDCPRLNSPQIPPISACHLLSVRTPTIVCACVIPLLYFYIYMQSKEKNNVYDLCN